MRLIYKAISPSGKFYVGKTTNLEQRKKKHRQKSFNIKSKEYNLPFHRAIRKYGFENIKWEIIQENIENDQLLNQLEIEYIQKLDAINLGYNRAFGGNGGPITEEAKQKISISKKGIPRNTETKEKLSKKRKKSGISKGNKNSMSFYSIMNRYDCSLEEAKSIRSNLINIKGKQREEATKQKISDSNKGKVAWNKNVPYNGPRNEQGRFVKYK